MVSQVQHIYANVAQTFVLGQICRMIAGECCNMLVDMMCVEFNNTFVFLHVSLTLKFVFGGACVHFISLIRFVAFHFLMLPQILIR